MSRRVVNQRADQAKQFVALQAAGSKNGRHIEPGAVSARREIEDVDDANAFPVLDEIPIEALSPDPVDENSSGVSPAAVPCGTF